MSKHKKTIEKLRMKNRNISFDKAQSLLLYMGFEQSKKDGSHRKFTHKEGININLKADRDLLGYAVEEMLQILEYFGVEEDV